MSNEGGMPTGKVTTVSAAERVTERKPTTDELQQACGMSILSDSGWKLNERTSITRRGIYDYERRILVSSMTDPAKHELLKKALVETNCPGWTPMLVQKRVAGDVIELMFTTTMDSSD